ncbi:MAG: hypothetical protein ACKVZ0_05275 [Gemmatimonadales bacterium]
MGRIGTAFAVGLLLGASTAGGQELPRTQPPPRTDWGTFDFERSTGITSGTLAGPADAVLAALPGLLTQLGLTVKDKDVDPAELLIVLKRQRLVRKLGKHQISKFLSCGDGLTGPNADSYYVYLTLNLRLVPKAARQTQLDMFFGAEAINVPGGQSDRIACATTGAFEMQLVAELQSRFPAVP